MSTPHCQRMSNPSPANSPEAPSHTHRAMAEGTTFTLALGNRPPSYQATVEDEPSITADDDHPGRHTTISPSTHSPDHHHSDSTATYVASDNGDHLTTTPTPWTPTPTSNATTPAPTEPYYPSSPPPMPDTFTDFDSDADADADTDPAAQACLDAFLQARIDAVRALRGPLPTEYEHLDFHSPGYNPAPRFQFRMQPLPGADGGGGGAGGGGVGLLPLSEIRRDLYILNAIYPEHQNLFVLMLRLYENCDPGDEMVLRSVNALPHMRYLVGLCRTCFLVVGGGEWCCGEVVPE